MTLKNKDLPLIWIRGAGDLATGVGVRLLNAGFKVIYSEMKQPTVIRRTVAFAAAVYEGVTSVEGHAAIECSDVERIEKALSKGQVPIYTGDETLGIVYFKPTIFIEGTIRKFKTDMPRNLVPYTIALGPGFFAPEDADGVVETMRGHYLGQVIWKGSAIPNTGIPGEVGGFSKERVIHAPVEGSLIGLKAIGDEVTAGETIAIIRSETITNIKTETKVITKSNDMEIDTRVIAPITGILRGLIYDGLWVAKGLKIADIDPRCNKNHCFSISDKARSIGGGVLEAVMVLILKSE